MKLCIKCGREMKRNLLMDAITKECFQKYNCIRCGIEIWEKYPKESSNNEQNNEQAEKDDGWISVKDRLPETNAIGIAHILAYDKREGTVKADFFDASANYVNGSNIFEISNTSTQLYKVTHWRPLPKPPKGEQIICVV